MRSTCFGASERVHTIVANPRWRGRTLATWRSLFKTLQVQRRVSSMCTAACHGACQCTPPPVSPKGCPPLSFFLRRERLPAFLLFRVHGGARGWTDHPRLRRREPPSNRGKESSALVARNPRTYVRNVVPFRRWIV